MCACGRAKKRQMPKINSTNTTQAQQQSSTPPSLRQAAQQVSAPKKPIYKTQTAKMYY